MAESIDFVKSFTYDAGQNGINVPVEIRLSGKVAAFDAKINTGSTNCILARRFGEEIGIVIEDGLSKHILTVNGSFLTYEHAITMSVFGYDFDILAGFAADAEFDKSVLGRHGFLMQVKLGLIDYEGKVFVSL